jgi:hypothetical protein
MTDVEIAENVCAANAALSSMRNKGARWWSFSVSHRTFDLVVGEPLGTDNVVLCLPACEYLAGPVRWPNQQIEVLIAPGSKAIIIQDCSVGFRAEGAGLFLWRRNYDIWSYHGVWGARGENSQLSIDEVTHGVIARLASYYNGEVGHSEVMYAVNAFLWYTLPIVGKRTGKTDSGGG